MKRPVENIAASVKQRLLNGAQARREQFELTLVRFGSERLLFRLGTSPHADRFVLKGGLLFLLWSDQIYRPTRDVDLLGAGRPDADTLRQVFREVCTMEAPGDGITFDIDSIRVETIRDAQEYIGLRVTLTAALGNARIPLQVDVGFGDAVTPPPERCELPTLLDHPAPTLRAYRRETVIAEKLHAMVDLGERNSRMKDFYDVWALARTFAFDGRELAGAIAATFERRGTAITTELPLALSSAFYADVARATQWRRFRDRQGLSHAPADFAVVGESVRGFLSQLLLLIVQQDRHSARWVAGGPWIVDVVSRGATEVSSASASVAEVLPPAAEDEVGSDHREAP